MLREYVGEVLRWLKRVVTQPLDELNRWQRAVRFGYDLGRYGAKQLRRDRAPQMAAALAFRTLFGLIPVLVVVMVVVRSVIGVDEFIARLGEILTAARLDEIRIIPPASVSAEPQSLYQWLRELVGEAAQINLAAVGWVGLAVMIYAAIGLIVTIENAFNIIYRAPGGRAWTRRVPLYWFVLTVSPVAVGVIAYVNSQLAVWVGSVETGRWFFDAVRLLYSGVLAWLLMFAVYTLVPNTRVEVKPALAGALVAVVLWEVGKRLLGAYFQHAFSISQLYGSLGLIPLFMFWVYLMWLAVLFGLEVAATLQVLRGRRVDEIEGRPEPSGLVDSTSVIAVMETIAERFRAGRPTSLDELADRTSLPRSTVLLMLDRLIEQGLLHRVEQNADAVCLAKPPDEIAADELLEIGYSLVSEVGRRSALIERLHDAQKQAAAKTTLAALLPTESVSRQ